MSENIGVSLKKGHHRLNGKNYLDMRDLDMMRKEILGELDVNNKLCRR